MAAAAIGVGALAFAPMTPAGAAPPTTFNPPSPPVIPPGGSSNFSAQCTGENTGDATVSLDGPGANDVGDTAVPVSANGSDGVVAIDLGGARSFGGIEPDTLGTYTYTVACPSGGGTTDFVIDVVTPTVDFTAGASADDCATSAVDAMIPMGTSVDLCYDFTNPLGEIVGTDGRILAVYQDVGTGLGGTNYTYPGWGGATPLPGGADYQVRGHGGRNYAPRTLDVYVVLEDASDNRAVSDLVRITITPTPAIDVFVTSGLTADTACPENGGQETRTVDAGTEVFFCYSAQLLSDIDINEHTIDSDVQGMVADADMSLMSGLGDTYEFGVATPVTIDTTTVNTATWTSEDYTDYSPEDVVITGTGAGTVNVEGETTTTIDDGVDGTGVAQPATPVKAQPTFTG
ncbi:hypothetical protein [Actinospongicola halichondriae]|uniref:hypothetical protein n=1 Tax=Actinospongicola halichondriae TaxID=3236844 RepID=UPI003D533388